MQKRPSTESQQNPIYIDHITATPPSIQKNHDTIIQFFFRTVDECLSSHQLPTHQPVAEHFAYSTAN